MMVGKNTPGKRQTACVYRQTYPSLFPHIRTRFSKPPGGHTAGLPAGLYMCTRNGSRRGKAAGAEAAGADLAAEQGLAGRREAPSGSGHADAFGAATQAPVLAVPEQLPVKGAGL